MRTLASGLVALSVLLGSSLAAAAPSTLVVNEVLANPSGQDDGLEWVELYNGGAAIDISGYKLQSATNTIVDRATVPANTTLAQGAYYVFAGAQVVVPEGVGHTALSSAADGVLGNAGGSSADLVRLVKGDGTVVDTLVYGPANTDGFNDDTGAVAVSLAPKTFSGEALARTVNGQDTDQCGVDFVNTTTPTVGAANQITLFNPDAGAPDGGSSGSPDGGEETDAGGSTSSSSSSGAASSSGGTSTSSSSGATTSSSSGGKSSSSSSGGKSSSSGGKSSSSGKTGSSGGDDDDDTTADDGGCNAGSGGSSLGLVLGFGVLVALLRRRSSR